MEQRQLGRGGPRLTVIGLGTWAIGGPWAFGWGRVNDEESVRAIHRALDAGINWIDTAAAYGLGHAEKIVGEAIRGMTERPFVATKCGLVPDGRGGVVRCLRPESIHQEIHESLKRLETDCIDLYQIHWPDASVPAAESWGVMADLQEEGKVRFVGVSNYDVPLLQECLSVAPVQSLQPPYSLLARWDEAGTLPFCRDHEIGVVCYSPMQSGLLSGSFDLSRLAPDDWRRGSSLFQEPQLSQALGFVNALRPIAASKGRSVGHLAVNWVLQNPAVTSAIVGARTGAQVEDNVKMTGWELSRRDLESIEALYYEHYPQT